jgi:hypothetical protein
MCEQAVAALLMNFKRGPDELKGAAAACLSRVLECQGWKASYLGEEGIKVRVLCTIVASLGALIGKPTWTNFPNSQPSTLQPRSLPNPDFLHFSSPTFVIVMLQ